MCIQFFCSKLCYFVCLKQKSKRVSVYMVKELPALGYLYNNVCNDVTCATHTICWDACGLA